MRVNLNLVQGIKKISNTTIVKQQPIRKIANSSFFKTIEKPLVVFNKGTRNVNINKFRNRNLKDLEKDLEEGKITQKEYNNAVKDVNTHYDTAKKTSADLVSSKDVKRETVNFKGNDENISLEEQVPLHEANLNEVDIENLDVALPEDLQEMLKEQGVELLDDDYEFLVEKIHYGITHGENFSEVFRDFIDSI